MQIIGWLSASKGRPFEFEGLFPLTVLDAPLIGDDEDPSLSLLTVVTSLVTGFKTVVESWLEGVIVEAVQVGDDDVAWISRREPFKSLRSWLEDNEDGPGLLNEVRVLFEGGDAWETWSWWLRIEGGEFEDVSEDVGDEEEVASNLSCCWVCRCSSWWLDDKDDECCLLDAEGVHFMVFPVPDPAISPMMQSTLLMILLLPMVVADEAVDPVEDKDQCLVLLEDKSKHPHWSTDSAFVEDVETVEEVEFDLRGNWLMLFGIKIDWCWEWLVVVATVLLFEEDVGCEGASGIIIRWVEGGEWGDGGEHEELERELEEQGKAARTSLGTSTLTGNRLEWNWFTMIEGRMWCKWEDVVAEDDGDAGVVVVLISRHGESRCPLLDLEYGDARGSSRLLLREVEAEAFLLLSFKSWNKLIFYDCCVPVRLLLPEVKLYK